MTALLNLNEQCDKRNQEKIQDKPGMSGSKMAIITGKICKNKKLLKVFKIVSGIIIEINICQISLNRNYKNKRNIKWNIKL